VGTNEKHLTNVFTTVLGVLTVLAIVLYFLASYLTTDLDSYKPAEVILENIKPVGQVNIASESDATDAAATPTSDADATPAAEPMTSEQMFQAKCFSCHGTGAAGAPKVGDAEAWAPHIAKGMDALLANTTNGLNAMPPKGLCMDCSEADLKALIEYMVTNSQ